MVALIIQTILLVAIAFILGCVLGCLLRRLLGSDGATVGADGNATVTQSAVVDTTSTGIASGAAVSATGTAAAQPAIPRPPIPDAPVTPQEPARVETPPSSVAAVPAGAAAKPAARKKTAAKKAASSSKSASKPAPKPAIPAAATADNLKLIRGIGPQNESRLNAIGINSFAQIAGWSKRDQAHYGETLSFPGRIEREEWVKQAKVLAKGGATEFAKRVKAGSVASSTGTATVADQGSKPSNLLDAPRGGKGDNLTLIDGVGNALEKKMFRLGVHHFDQVAAMSDAELRWLGTALGFPGRPERENWRGEAETLAAGGTTEHAKRVERGQIRTSRKFDS